MTDLKPDAVPGKASFDLVILSTSVCSNDNSNCILGYCVVMKTIGYLYHMIPFESDDIRATVKDFEIRGQLRALAEPRMPFNPKRLAESSQIAFVQIF